MALAVIFLCMSATSDVGQNLFLCHCPLHFVITKPKDIIPQGGSTLFFSVYVPAHLFQQAFLLRELPVEGGQTIERRKRRGAPIRENVSMLDRPHVPGAVSSIVQCLKAAAITVVPDFQNDGMAHRRKGAAVYGHNIARMEGDGQIYVVVNGKVRILPAGG